MERVKNEEMKNIKGGGTITFNATFLNAIYKISSLVFDIGKELGSSIRRISTDSVCPVK